MEKNFFFAPLALGLGATRRAAMLLLVMLLTTATAWAAEVLRGGTESAPVAITTTAEIITTKYGTSVGYFVVNENTTITHQVRVGYSSDANIYISIPTGKTLTVEVTGSDPGLRYWIESCALHVYGGGTLVVSNGIETYGGTCDMHNITINGAHYDDDGYLDGSIHTVTFNSKGGTAVASQTFGLKYGQTIATVTEPTAPTRTNYNFGGWYKESSCTNAWDFASDGVTADVTLYAKWTPDPAHFSQSGDTYTIKTAEGWNVFCDLLADNAKGYFTGKTVKLGDDITVTRMAGGSQHDFTGTFDGDSHTLTFNYTTAEDYAAPFRNVESGCVIENLHVSGTINTSAKFAAGLVGDQYGAVTIRNCRVSVTINSTVSGDGTHAGFVARNGNGSGSVLTIEGCVFDGSLLGSTTNSCGGFIGWRYKAATIRNSLFAPTEVTVLNEGSATFARNTTDTYNSYYTTLFNDGTNYAPALADGTVSPAKWHNGKATRTVTAGTDVTIKAIALTGTATQYTVSGITAYSGGGLQRGETLYYGSDDQLSLTLSNTATAAPQGYQYGYTASAGTLSGSTLTMPDENVTISVNTAVLLSTRQPVTVAYINADGTTDEASAIALDGHEAVDGDGDVCLDEGTYYVGTDITYANQIYLNGNVTLILCDGKTMTLNGNTAGIINDSRNLTIYGQSLDDDAGTLSYNGTADGITVNNYEQHSGNVSITTTGSTIDSWVWGIDANAVTLRGGTITVTANSTNAIAIMSGTHSILGGQLTATATGTDATGIYASASSGTALTLGWTRPADRITVSSISTPEGGTVAVKDGQALTDGSGNKVVLSGTLTSEQITAIAGKTLRPCLALADAADNSSLITAANGRTLNVTLQGRTLQTGSWNTFAVPFSADIPNGWTVKELTGATDDGSTLTLTFGDAASIEAGKPYLVEVTEAALNPTFNEVIVSSTPAPSVFDGVISFVPTFGLTSLPEGKENILFLATGNTLKHPSAEGQNLKGFRAYFQLNGANQTRSIRLDLGENVTGVEMVQGSRFKVQGSDGATYNLSGQKVSDDYKGIVIKNGKKVVIE